MEHSVYYILQLACQKWKTSLTHELYQCSNLWPPKPSLIEKLTTLRKHFPISTDDILAEYSSCVSKIGYTSFRMTGCMRNSNHKLFRIRNSRTHFYILIRFLHLSRIVNVEAKFSRWFRSPRWLPQLPKILRLWFFYESHRTRKYVPWQKSRSINVCPYAIRFWLLNGNFEPTILPLLLINLDPWKGASVNCLPF